MNFKHINMWEIFHRPPLSVLCLFLAIALASCSESGIDMAGGGIGGTGKSIGTITAKGSITVNDTKFTTTGAQIVFDDKSGTEDDLQVGMTAKVLARFSADGLTGNAEKVEVDDEVQGEITSFGPEPDSFTVLAQKISVDGLTTYGNVSGLAELQSLFTTAPPVVVEIHGQRVGTGTIIATRVELLAGVRLAEEDELKGIASGLSGTTFFIGTQYIETAGATIEPDGSRREDIRDGILAEVHGAISGTHPAFGPIFLARSVDIEELEDADFAFENGDEFEIEGFITEFDGPGDRAFKVAGFAVELADDVRFVGGVAADLEDDIKVEAEGRVTAGGIRLVEKIKFKDSVRIEAKVEDKGVEDNGSDWVTLFGKKVLITSQTKIRVKLGFASIGVGDGMKVRGFVNQDNATITATRIDDPRPAGPEKQVLQGPVDSFDRNARKLVIIGITVDASGVAEGNFKSDDDQTIGSNQFFGILENATGIVVVKARGVFDGTMTITADTVEIE